MDGALAGPRANRGGSCANLRLGHLVALNVRRMAGPNLYLEAGCRARMTAALRAGANDVGGTLMNESISRAAGTEHGQEFPPDAMDALIVGAGRRPAQRTTLYGVPDPAQLPRSYDAQPLRPLVTGEATRQRELA